MSIFNKFIIIVLPLLPKFFVKLFSGRYVAGNNFKQALNTVKKLNLDGQCATLDILGEHTAEKNNSKAITEKYISLVKYIDSNNADCNLSIKPSHIGLDIDYSLALTNYISIVNEAEKFNNFIRLDMESSKATDLTIRLHNELRELHRNVGIVIQAYLKRSEQDIMNLPDNSNIRICKGIYNENERISYKKYEDINENFLRLLKICFEKNFYVAIATHDILLINSCIEIINEYNIKTEMFEFQYLLGVPMDNAINNFKIKNYKVRSYVPFGKDWYDYSIRRIKENPKIGTYVLKNLFYK
ncbi:MAG: proline dehydrogenase [Candidatus Marinimicrobia bacterium]|nr:proline dehydrogenase [Candidatus Neomarinimicrobiota bacterium]